MVREIRQVRELTRLPFGVDLLTAMPGGLENQVRLLIEEGASVFVAGLGVPAEVVALCHEADVVVVNMCGKVEHARRAVHAGCDLVVAQGTEAGGHTGQVATMPLVPQIVDAVGASVPVVAAGGIFDGRGPRGGAGARSRRRVGGHPISSRRPRRERCRATRTRCSPPARTHRREPGLFGQDDAGHPQFVHGYFDDHPDELAAFPAQLGRSMGDGAFHLGGRTRSARRRPSSRVLPGGPGTGAIKDLVPAGELVRRFVEEAETALAVSQPTGQGSAETRLGRVGGPGNGTGMRLEPERVPVIAAVGQSISRDSSLGPIELAELAAANALGAASGLGEAIDTLLVVNMLSGRSGPSPASELATRLGLTPFAAATTTVGGKHSSMAHHASGDRDQRRSFRSDACRRRRVRPLGTAPAPIRSAG